MVRPTTAAEAEAETAATRKGPWTEQEDLQLVWFVRLFGERRWDFLAKVSGLNRSGKSCRLRWVNYLQPGLKRGRMTPQEELLVLELHSQWGNRWSRIARRLPGRTDNEIKNYWRTHMRKKAQERKEISSSSSSSSPSSSNLSSSVNAPPPELREGSSSIPAGVAVNDEVVKGYTMDQIWNEMAAASESVSDLSFEDYSNVECPPMSSSIWEEDCSQSLWGIDEEELRMLNNPMPDLLHGL